MPHEVAVQSVPLAGRFISPYSTEVWHTASGSTLQLAFMRTEHLFFCFRMLYDRIAAEQGWELARPVGEGLQASRALPEARVAYWMAAFATDVLLRSDLPDEHRAAFWKMLATIRGGREIQAVDLLLEMDNG